MFTIEKCSIPHRKGDLEWCQSKWERYSEIDIWFQNPLPCSKSRRLRPKKKVFITQTPTFICKSKIQIPWNTKIHNCATIELKFWVNEFFCEYLPSRYFSRPYGQNWESFVTEVKSENHEKYQNPQFPSDWAQNLCKWVFLWIFTI